MEAREYSCIKQKKIVVLCSVEKLKTKNWYFSVSPEKNLYGRAYSSKKPSIGHLGT